HDKRGDALHLSLLRTFIRSIKFKTPKSRKMIGRFFYPSANIKRRGRRFLYYFSVYVNLFKERIH
ncbi:hypothetical protein, partial [Prevotella intermedia]|uniref:hypothetical protein n=1 Tax=Prevotella intermedia TaxID=28131 RepID=UPI001C54D857